MMKDERGQTLLEILIAISIAAIVIGAAAYGISFILTSTTVNQQRQSAVALAEDLVNKVRSVADANWLDIYNLDGKGATSTYHVVASGTAFIVATGTQLVTVDGVDYTISFSVENVKRDALDNIVTEGGNDDPSTQKIIAAAQWTVGTTTPKFQVVDYLIRWQNRVFNQTDWSGGSGQEGPLTDPNNKFASSTSNIDFVSTPGVIKLNL
jgi:prepilin-type N-terminal cleavage/methylation domain-containing protein